MAILCPGLPLARCQQLFEASPDELSWLRYQYVEWWWRSRAWAAGDREVAVPALLHREQQNESDQRWVLPQAHFDPQLPLVKNEPTFYCISPVGWRRKCLATTQWTFVGEDVHLEVFNFMVTKTNVQFSCTPAEDNVQGFCSDKKSGIFTHLENFTACQNIPGWNDETRNV